MMFQNAGINLTIRDQVYKILRSAIVTGEFQLGEQLKESQLAERLNVSRSPIREALRQLSGDGLVVNIPHKGMYVRQITKAEIEDVFDLRMILEGRGIALSKQNMTPQRRQTFFDIRAKLTASFNQKDLETYSEADYALHKEVTALCNNSLINEMNDRVYLITQLLRVSALKDTDRFEKSYMEHLQFIDSILAGDLETASRIGRVHLEETKEQLFKVIGGGDEPDLTEPQKKGKSPERADALSGPRR